MKASHSLKARALQLLAQREQSKLELRRKLRAHARRVRVIATLEPGEMSAANGLAIEPGLESETGFDVQTEVDTEAEIETVLAWLEANRFLSSERFAESRVNARVGRFGNRRIRPELAQHEVALSPAAEKALVDSELDRARAVQRRKFAAPPCSAVESARQARFLAARGFSADVIRRVLRDGDKRAARFD